MLNTFFFIKGGILARWQILLKVWKLIIVVFVTFFITLWVFPSLTSLVQDCNLGSWPSVILAFIFNFTDFLSRLFARIPFHWKPRYLMLGSLARILLVPLFLLCVVPSPTYPVINHPLWLAAVLSAMLGATNGYIGTLGMQYAPQMVDNNQKELTGWFLKLVSLLFTFLSRYNYGVFFTGWINCRLYIS
jgi:solute carrier family 29 (equilibrative nucleoside transporter) protein 4